MRLSNKKKSGFYNFINTLLLMALVLGISIFLFEKYRFGILGWESSLFIIIPVLLLILFYFRGKQIFEYDSDGETLNFKNRSVIPILGKPVSDEFPKYKLLKYEIANLIFIKRLYVTVSSKKSHSIILRYDISYLTRQEINDLKFSLSKVIKSNKENKIEKEKTDD